MQKGILAVALLLVGGACGGGGSSSSASVNGTIDGQSMGAQDAVSNVFTSGSNSEGGILITNSANTCAKLSAGQRIDSNGYAGTLDLTFSGTAGHVTGSFSANRCAALSMNIGGTCT